jgi:hypothetical protein
MKKYTYSGTTEVSLQGYGHVQPGETIEVAFAINNPDFVEVKEKIYKKPEGGKDNKTA